MKLIIVQGSTGTGKTTLTKRLAKDLQCSYFSKDGYKEQMYDELGKVPNLRQSAFIEHEAWRKLYEAVAAWDRKTSFIIESNFSKKHKLGLNKVLKDEDVVCEVYCYARGLTSTKRFFERCKRGEWHKGHRPLSLGIPIVVWFNFRTLVGLPIHTPYAPAEFVHKLDTTDFAKVDYDQILQFVKS